MLEERRFDVGNFTVVIGKPGGPGLPRPVPFVYLYRKRQDTNKLEIIEDYRPEDARALAQALLAAAEYAEFGTMTKKIKRAASVTFNLSNSEQVESLSGPVPEDVLTDIRQWYADGMYVEKSFGPGWGAYNRVLYPVDPLYEQDHPAFGEWAVQMEEET